MRIFAALSCVVFAATCSYAQINERTLTVAGLTDCFAEAIATGSVVDGGSTIIFSCSAAKAKTLDNFLGKKSALKWFATAMENSRIGHLGIVRVTTGSKIKAVKPQMNSAAI